MTRPSPTSTPGAASRPTRPGAWPWSPFLQFREGLSDRRAAEAARARIDRKYLLGLDLADPGFGHGVSCELRDRPLRHAAVERLLAGVPDAALTASR